MGAGGRRCGRPPPWQTSVWQMRSYRWEAIGRRQVFAKWAPGRPRRTLSHSLPCIRGCVHVQGRVFAKTRERPRGPRPLVYYVGGFPNHRGTLTSNLLCFRDKRRETMTIGASLVSHPFPSPLSLKKHSLFCYPSRNKRERKRKGGSACVRARTRVCVCVCVCVCVPPIHGNDGHTNQR